MFFVGFFLAGFGLDVGILAWKIDESNCNNSSTEQGLMKKLQHWVLINVWRLLFLLLIYAFSRSGLPYPCTSILSIL